MAERETQARAMGHPSAELIGAKRARNEEKMKTLSARAAAMTRCERNSARLRTQIEILD
jgi:hypothetical protein